MIKKIDPNQIIEKYLKNKVRKEHSHSTANFMKKYAELFNINQEHAFYSGLLHDIAKEMSENEIIELSDSFNNRKIINIKYFDFKKNHPVLLHGVASAEILFKKYGLDNKDILESICTHTFGGNNISDLAIFTFISDYCEPLRKHPNSKKIYEIIVYEKNLYKAFYFTYIYIIKRLLKKQKVIIPDSIEGYNYSLKLYKK